ncbi:MAG: hypothetical protein HGA85_07535 [Nanoarchaeota archaeon]|nr:hypothetical protein [Nanoarchaeota archaeon]
MPTHDYYNRLGQKQEVTIRSFQALTLYEALAGAYAPNQTTFGERDVRRIAKNLDLNGETSGLWQILKETDFVVQEVSEDPAKPLYVLASRQFPDRAFIDIWKTEGAYKGQSAD